MKAGRPKISDAQKEINKIIGSNIKKYRNLLGIDQLELGRKIDKNRLTISAYELGKRSIDDQVLDDLAKALQVKKEQLKAR